MVKKNVIVTKVSKNRWQKAQQFEIEAQISIMGSHNDWNDWWKRHFDNYKAIKGKTFKRVLEVGCGPHTNLRLMLNSIKVDEIYLEDPLMQPYLTYEEPQPLKVRFKEPLKRDFNWLQTLVKNQKYKVHLTSAPLEDLPFKDQLFDMVICNNVLDHVYDYESCMKEMDRVLRKRGILVFGQDMSNEEDYERAEYAWRDVGHPIKLDEATLNKNLKNYRVLFKKILPRNQGRNPDAHYGTYLLIAVKR